MAIDTSDDLAVFFDVELGLAERAVYRGAGGGEVALVVVLEFPTVAAEAGPAHLRVPQRRAQAIATDLAGVGFDRADVLEVTTGRFAGRYAVSGRTLDESGDIALIALGAAV